MGVGLGFGSRLTSPGIPFALKIDIGDPRLRETVESGVRGFLAPLGVPAPGETTFSFRITAPAQKNFYFIAVCMVDDNPADPMWFGQGWLQKLYVQ